MSDEVITLDSFPYLRRAVWGSLIRTLLRYVGMWLAAGLGLAAIGHLVRDNGLLYFFAGLAIGTPALFLAVRWTWHFSLQLRQLSSLEARVRGGESIPISDTALHVYGARKLA
jgi:hypothetical protein